MRNKFIGTSSFLMKGAAACFNVIAFILMYIGVVKAIRGTSVLSILFAIITVTAFVVSVLVSKNILKNGVQFYKDFVEFTIHDENNTYFYDNIDKIEVHKDTEASLKKNIVDRYSSIILYLNDGTVATVELGITSEKILRDIEKELLKRAG